MNERKGRAGYLPDILDAVAQSDALDELGLSRAQRTDEAHNQSADQRPAQRLAEFQRFLGGLGLEGLTMVVVDQC